MGEGGCGGGNRKHIISPQKHQQQQHPQQQTQQDDVNADSKDISSPPPLPPFHSTSSSSLPCALFVDHIRREHNMWTYFFFKLYLQAADASSLTGPEHYAHTCFASNEAFVRLAPIGRSAALERAAASATTTRAATPSSRE